MNLVVSIPERIVVQETGVKRIIAESPEGSFGIYPHRLDLISPLVQGILVFEKEGAGERYVAVDEGVLTKMGADVVVSVRSAAVGQDLQEMQTLVEQEFRQRSDQEENVRLVLARIEDDFIHLYRETQNG